jgi:hypothetical protein
MAQIPNKHSMASTASRDYAPICQYRYDFHLAIVAA